MAVGEEQAMPGMGRNVGQTASEVIQVLGPQIERVETKLDAFAAESRQDRRLLAETQARHDVRLSVLEKKGNGNGNGNGTAKAEPAAETKPATGARLTVKEFLLLAGGISLLSGGAGAGIAKLLELVK